MKPAGGPAPLGPGGGAGGGGGGGGAGGGIIISLRSPLLAGSWSDLEIELSSRLSSIKNSLSTDPLLSAEMRKTKEAVRVEAETCHLTCSDVSSLTVTAGTEETLGATDTACLDTCQHH